MASSGIRSDVTWKDLLDLRVVKRLCQIIEQRWNLGVCFFEADGSPIRGEELTQPFVDRSLCDLIKTRMMCGNHCVDLQALAERTEEASPSSPDGGRRSLICSCSGGLREIIAPIVLDGKLQGSAVAGGYLREESGAGSAAETFLGDLELTADQLAELTGALPRLSASEEAYLRELVELLAEEVITFQTELASTDRRLGGTPVRYAYEDIIGESAPMQALYRLLDKVIDSDSTVLIQGENGTGKELIAKAIHFNSSRKKRQFVVQNCSAFNDNLLDSELFGHKKGSFTGAISDKRGLFEVADGSTFFLDEIGDMSPSLQVKLLRVLQEGTFIMVGDTELKKVDVRIIAATNRNLKLMVERGEFREDLYYRVNVINITIPPLRERREDIPRLVSHFLIKQAKGNRRNLKKLSKDCLQRLVEYNWPGNVRELENEVERLVVLAGEEKLITEEMLSSRIRRPVRPQEGLSRRATCLPEAIESLERNMIYEALKRHRWNKTRAAEELHISRRNLIRKVNKYQLDQRG
jgi:transcriptional regulator with GAF, ATPase, and Fis domain